MAVHGYFNMIHPAGHQVRIPHGERQRDKDLTLLHYQRKGFKLASEVEAEKAPTKKGA